KTGRRIHGSRRVLIDELIRKYHAANAQALIEQPLLGQFLQDVRTEAANSAFLDRDEHFVLARKARNQIDIEGLGKARICDRGRQAKCRKLLGRLEAIAEPPAI